jgi:hypothetical protein
MPCPLLAPCPFQILAGALLSVCCSLKNHMEVMIFFEKNKVLGVEANRVLNILEEIKKNTTLRERG